jgi:hypothetical protein
MKLQILIMLFLAGAVSCKHKTEIKEQVFDKEKWTVKKENKYVYRNAMVKDLMENRKLHGTKRDSVLNVLGAPNRQDTGYLFYTVDQRFLANTLFPIHTKTMVIHFRKDSTVEWVKIHE